MRNKQTKITKAIKNINKIYVRHKHLSKMLENAFAKTTRLCLKVATLEESKVGILNETYVIRAHENYEQSLNEWNNLKRLCNANLVKLENAKLKL